MGKNNQINGLMKRNWMAFNEYEGNVFSAKRKATQTRLWIFIKDAQKLKQHKFWNSKCALYLNSSSDILFCETYSYCCKEVMTYYYGHYNDCHDAKGSGARSN